MEHVIGCVLIMAISLPASFYAARGCLQIFIYVISWSAARSTLAVERAQSASSTLRVRRVFPWVRS
jgi:hypothetical protein